VDPTTQTPLAVKEIGKQKLIVNPVLKRLLDTEEEVLKSISHPHIIKLLEV
jgi:serine/threonine protein kinase